MPGWQQEMSGWQQEMSGWQQEMLGWQQNLSGWQQVLSGSPLRQPGCRLGALWPLAADAAAPQPLLLSISLAARQLTWPLGEVVGERVGDGVVPTSSGAPVRSPKRSPGDGSTNPDHLQTDYTGRAQHGCLLLLTDNGREWRPGMGLTTWAVGWGTVTTEEWGS